MRSGSDKRKGRLAPVLAALGTTVVVLVFVGSVVWAFLASGGADTIAVGIMALYALAGIAVIAGCWPPWSSGCGSLREERKRMPDNTDGGKRALKREAVKGTVLFLGGQGLSILALLWLKGWVSGWLDTLLLVLAVGDLAAMPFAFVVLRQRMKEIEGGELDAARKY